MVGCGSEVGLLINVRSSALGTPLGHSASPDPKYVVVAQPSQGEGGGEGGERGGEGGKGGEGGLIGEGGGDEGLHTKLPG